MQSLSLIANIASAGEVDYVDLPWGALRYSHTQAIRSSIAESYSASTANRHLSSLRNVMRTAWRLSQIEANDLASALDFKCVKGEKANAAEKGRHLTQGEFQSLLQTCDNGSKQGMRNTAMLILAYTCGLRRAELANLNIECVDIPGCKISVTGKGSKERIIPLAESACDSLNDWTYTAERNTGPVFVRILKGDHLTDSQLTPESVLPIFAKVAEESQVKTFTPHDLRRTFAGDLLDNQVDISTVSQLMGHSSVNTTKQYDRRGARAKRKAIDTLHVPYTRKFT